MFVWRPPTHTRELRTLLVVVGACLCDDLELPHDVQIWLILQDDEVWARWFEELGNTKMCEREEHLIEHVFDWASEDFQMEAINGDEEDEEDGSSGPCEGRGRA